ERSDPLLVPERRDEFVEGEGGVRALVLEGDAGAVGRLSRAHPRHARAKDERIPERRRRERERDGVAEDEGFVDEEARAPEPYIFDGSVPLPTRADVGDERTQVDGAARVRAEGPLSNPCRVPGRVRARRARAVGPRRRHVPLAGTLPQRGCW